MSCNLVEGLLLTTLLNTVDRNVRYQRKNAQIKRLKVSHSHRVTWICCFEMLSLCFLFKRHVFEVLTNQILRSIFQIIVLLLDWEHFSEERHVLNPSRIFRHLFFLLVFLISSLAIFGYLLTINIELNHFVDDSSTQPLPFTQSAKTYFNTILFIVKTLKRFFNSVLLILFRTNIYFLFTSTCILIWLSSTCMLVIFYC